jgi:hypothetical protein
MPANSIKKASFFLKDRVKDKIVTGGESQSDGRATCGHKSG